MVENFETIVYFTSLALKPLWADDDKNIIHDRSIFDIAHGIEYTDWSLDKP